MPDFVTLSCPTCGGRLQITKDIERFACGHCGNEHLVSRGGGIVTLSPVVEGLKRIERGTDRIAAEVALNRLTQELRESERELLRCNCAVWTKEDFGMIADRLRELGQLSDDEVRTSSAKGETREQFRQRLIADLPPPALRQLILSNERGFLKRPLRPELLSFLQRRLELKTRMERARAQIAKYEQELAD